MADALRAGPLRSGFNTYVSIFFLPCQPGPAENTGTDAKPVGLTSRVGEHQSRNVASNQGQAAEHSTDQGAKLQEHP